MDPFETEENVAEAWSIQVDENNVEVYLEGQPIPPFSVWDTALSEQSAPASPIGLEPGPTDDQELVPLDESESRDENVPDLPQETAPEPHKEPVPNEDVDSDPPGKLPRGPSGECVEDQPNEVLPKSSIECVLNPPNEVSPYQLRKCIYDKLEDQPNKLLEDQTPYGDFTPDPPKELASDSQGNTEPGKPNDHFHDFCNDPGLPEDQNSRFHDDQEDSFNARNDQVPINPSEPVFLSCHHDGGQPSRQSPKHCDLPESNDDQDVELHCLIDEFLNEIEPALTPREEKTTAPGQDDAIVQSGSKQAEGNDPPTNSSSATTLELPGPSASTSVEMSSQIEVLTTVVEIDCEPAEDRPKNLLQMAVNQSKILEEGDEQELTYPGLPSPVKEIVGQIEKEASEILQHPGPSTTYQGNMYPIFHGTAQIAMAVFDRPVQGPLQLRPSISPITGQYILCVVESEERPEGMDSQPEGRSPSYTLKINKCFGDSKRSMQINYEDLQYDIKRDRPVCLQIGVEGMPGAMVEAEVTISVVFSQADRALVPVVPTKVKPIKAPANPMFQGDEDLVKDHVFRAGTKGAGEVRYFQDQQSIRKVSLTLTEEDKNQIFLLFPHLTDDVEKNKMWDLVVEVTDQSQKIPIQVMSEMRSPPAKRKRQNQDYYKFEDP